MYRSAFHDAKRACLAYLEGGGMSRKEALTTAIGAAKDWAIESGLSRQTARESAMLAVEAALDEWRREHPRRRAA